MIRDQTKITLLEVLVASTNGSSKQVKDKRETKIALL